MVFGAGLYQVSGIKKARSIGLRVLSIDSRLLAPGHLASSWAIFLPPKRVVLFFNCLEVLWPSHRRPIVATFGSELGALLIGHLRKLENIQLTTNKAKFRSIQDDLGIPKPRFWLISRNFRQDGPVFLAFEKPMLLKPNIGSGARGVVRLPQQSRDVVMKAIDFARNSSADGNVLIEEFVDGDEIGGQAILRDGQFWGFMISDKLRDNYFTVGHTAPSSFEVDGELIRGIRSQLLAVCRKLNYSDGPINFDAIVEGSKATLLEVALRTSGNGLCEVMAEREDVDPELETIIAAFEVPVVQADKWRSATTKQSKTKRWKYTSSILLRSPRKLFLKRNSCELPRTPNFEFISLNLKFGIQPAWREAGDEIGYAVFNHNDTLATIEDQVLAALPFPLIRGSAQV